MKRKEKALHTPQKCIEYVRKVQDAKLLALQNKLSAMTDKVMTLEASLQEPSLRFNEMYKDLDIFIEKNGKTALVREHKRKRRDRFVLLDLKEPLGDSDLTWQFSIDTIKSDWYALGISECSNVYSQKLFHDIGHMSYLISANGVLYNSHNPYENWQQRNFKLEQGDVILCKYRPKKLKLYFLNTSKNLKLHTTIDLALIQQSQFYPCSCLRCPGEKISIQEVHEVDDSHDDDQEEIKN